MCSIEIFEKIKLERYNLCLELYKTFKKNSPKDRKSAELIAVCKHSLNVAQANS